MAMKVRFVCWATAHDYGVVVLSDGTTRRFKFTRGGARCISQLRYAPPHPLTYEYWHDKMKWPVVIEIQS